ncbi:stAR-related lipid transfer protein 4 isoform X2 [Larus michahellis]|uniref:stAR-related lipid transfer protein 4 isoform X2 n=1 Tax=Larus michahellis TaxID=119627 RepID=UPI003D9AE36C
MDLLPDAAPLATKLRNTLVQYHSIPDSEWRVAKRTVSAPGAFLPCSPVCALKEAEKDATVWRKPSEEFSGYLYKAQGVVEDVTNRIVDHIRPGPYRLDWDSLMTTMDILETFEENCCVMRYTTAGQLWNIIAPREFVDFSYTTSYEDGLLTCGISLDYGEVRPNFVRGFNHPCGWFCVPLKDYPSHSLLTGYIQTELRGMLPRSAVDTAMSSTLANFYSDLKKALKTDEQ